MQNLVSMVELLGRYSKMGPLPQFTLEPRTARRTNRPNDSAASSPGQRHKVRQRLSPAEQTELVERYTAGASMNELMKAFRLGKGTVRGLLEEAGVVRHQRRLAEAELQQAERLYIEGLSLGRVGEQLGFSADAIWLALRRRGVAMRRPWER